MSSKRGDSLVAILEVAGVSKGDLEIQAKDNTIGEEGSVITCIPDPTR